MKSYKTPSKNSDTVVRSHGTTKFLIDSQHFDAIYRTTKKGLDKITDDLPGLSFSVTYSPSKSEKKPFKIVLGSGNFSTVRLARRLLDNGKPEYYAVKKIKNGSEQHQAVFPRDNVLLAAEREFQLHNKLQKVIGPTYLPYVSLIKSADYSINRKKQKQFYEFIPLAEMGNAKQFLDRFNFTNPSTVEFIQFTESLAMMLLLTLNHLHKRRFYHLDIKLDNVLIQRSGQALLADFGAASHYSLHEAPLRALSASFSKYAPPKLLFRKGKSSTFFNFNPIEFKDRQHDIWSLGLTLLSICDPALEREYTLLHENLTKLSPNDALSSYKDLHEKIKTSSLISPNMRYLLADLLNPNFDTKNSTSKITSRWIGEQSEALALEEARKKIKSFATKVIRYEKDHSALIITADEPIEHSDEIESCYATQFSLG